MKRHRMVEVLWEDASMAGNWQDGEMPTVPKGDENVVRSCGYLIHKTRTWVVIAQTLADASCHGNALKIPRKMVRSLTFLEKKVA